MKKQLLYILLTCLIFCACVGLFSQRADRAAAEGSRAAADILEQSLYRAALTCYACEGAYPDTLDYLCQNYGVGIDQDLYAVHYEIFASNIMPEITVVKLNEK